ncbi:MAG TPA: tRNA pseudouridine(13) synthase TruD [Lysobacter sp.]
MSALALPQALGPSVLSATLRTCPEDFIVEEIPGFEPSGAGEHLLLDIEKRGLNTAFAVRRIAEWAGVKEMAVGYAGLKDRHAVTRQRISVHLPGREAPDVATLQDDSLRVLSATRHSRKLPRGALAGNRFVLTLREVAGDRAAIDARLATIATRGVPNYFGEQRFGRAGDNVQQAIAMFAGRRVRREERGLLLSAARSELFNRVLAERVRRDCWDAPLDGEVWMLDGRRSVFGPEPLTGALRERLAAFDIHPTGPLWGRGEPRTAGECRQLEDDVLGDDVRALRLGLEAAGLEQERRALRLRPAAFGGQWLEPDVLQLRFELPPGAYATTVLDAIGGTQASPSRYG